MVAALLAGAVLLVGCADLPATPDGAATQDQTVGSAPEGSAPTSTMSDPTMSLEDWVDQVDMACADTKEEVQAADGQIGSDATEEEIRDFMIDAADRLAALADAVESAGLPEDGREDAELFTTRLDEVATGFVDLVDESNSIAELLAASDTLDVPFLRVDLLALDLGALECVNGDVEELRRALGFSDDLAEELADAFAELQVVLGRAGYDEGVAGCVAAELRRRDPDGALRDVGEIDGATLDEIVAACTTPEQEAEAAIISDLIGTIVAVHADLQDRGLTFDEASCVSDHLIDLYNSGRLDISDNPTSPLITEALVSCLTPARRGELFGGGPALPSGGS